MPGGSRFLAFWIRCASHVVSIKISSMYGFTAGGGGGGEEAKETIKNAVLKNCII